MRRCKEDGVIALVMTVLGEWLLCPTGRSESMSSTQSTPVTGPHSSQTLSCSSPCSSKLAAFPAARPIPALCVVMDCRCGANTAGSLLWLYGSLKPLASNALQISQVVIAVVVVVDPPARFT